MTEWRYIDSSPGDPWYNMALDEAIALTVMRSGTPPTLRVYGWAIPAVSIGALQRTKDIDLEYCCCQGIPVVRRPTGGRGLLHDDELTYSFSSPSIGPFASGLFETYRQLNLAICSALSLLGISADLATDRLKRSELLRSPWCFETLSFGELHAGRAKIVGSAQKRWPNSFLQQGSIPYSLDRSLLDRIFRAPNEQAFPSAHSGEGQDHGLRPVITGIRAIVPRFDEETFKRLMIEAFQKTFSVKLAAGAPSPEEQALALQLVEQKYRQPRWTVDRKACSQS